MGPVRNADRLLDHLKIRDRCLDCLDLKGTGYGLGVAAVAQNTDRQQAAFCECGYEPSGAIKGGEYLTI